MVVAFKKKTKKTLSSSCLIYGFVQRTLAVLVEAGDLKVHIGEDIKIKEEQVKKSGQIE